MDRCIYDDLIYNDILVSGNKIHYSTNDADPNAQASGRKQDIGLILYYIQGKFQINEIFKSKNHNAISVKIIVIIE